MMRRIVGFLLFSFFPPVASAQSLTDTEAIIRNSITFSGNILRSNYTKIAEAYTDDAKIFPPNLPIVQGREAIRRYWTLPEGVSMIHHRSESAGITINGSTAYDYGYYEGIRRGKDGAEIFFKGKYLIVWKKIRDDWKIYLDMWNPVR